MKPNKNQNRRLCITRALLAFSALFASASAFADDNALTPAFRDFEGDYEIVSCSGRMLQGADPKEIVDHLCDRKFAHVFRGDGYAPKPAGRSYFYSLSNLPYEATDLPELIDAKWVGLTLAWDPSDGAGQQQTIIVYGSSMRIAKDHSFIAQATVTKQNEFVYLHDNVVWPQPGQRFLFNDLSLVLKRIEQKRPATLVR